MNSGIRFSVALIVVIMVLLGFYYASLDDGTGGDGATDSGPEIVVDQEAPAPEATQAAEPPVNRPSEPEPSVVVVEPTDIEDVATADGPDVTEEFDEFPIDDGVDTTVTDVTASDSDMGFDAGVNEPETSTTLDVDVSETETDTEIPTDPEPEPTPEPESPEDGIDAGSPPSRDVASGRAGTEDGSVEIVRGLRADGVGIHRLATIELDQTLANAAIRALTEADQAGIIEGPAGSAWIPLPEGVPSELLEGAITDRVPGDATRHILVLTGKGDAVDLAGRVQSTEISGSEAAGGWTLRFRLAAENAETIRVASRGFVGRSVAWIGDGRILAIDRQLIPISGQANVPVRFASEAAASNVSRLLEASSTDTRIATPSGPATPRNVVRGAGSLPPDSYTDYIVRPGDTFESIAAAWFGDRNKHSLIAIANPYKESSRLAIGEVLRLPPRDTPLTVEIPGSGASGGPTIYVVKSGDTLGKIAQAAYGKASLWTRIHEANRDLIGDDPGNLKVGMSLEIPQ